MFKTKAPPKGATRFWDDIDSFRRLHKSEILAIKAVGAGTATDVQQRKAMSFIITHLCRADEINFYSDERDTNFALGREAVGKILRGISLGSDWIDGDII